VLAHLAEISLLRGTDCELNESRQSSFQEELVLNQESDNWVLKKEQLSGEGRHLPESNYYQSTSGGISLPISLLPSCCGTVQCRTCDEEDSMGMRKRCRNRETWSTPSRTAKLRIEAKGRMCGISARGCTAQCGLASSIQFPSKHLVKAVWQEQQAGGLFWYVSLSLSLIDLCVLIWDERPELSVNIEYYI